MSPEGTSRVPDFSQGARAEMGRSYQLTTRMLGLISSWSSPSM